jgi:site-specific DNA-methyltransferase (cytosine-N4-specific)
VTEGGARSPDVATIDPAGAPPLDWWTDTDDEPISEGTGKVKLLIGDVRDRIREIPDGSVDLICTSPPFLALRKYGDQPDAEMGSEATPVAFIDALLELTAEFRRVLAPHGSIAIELGDTYSGSGGAGGDYNDNGLRAGQPKATGSGKLARFADDRGKPTTMRDTTFSGANTSTGGGNGWPQAKSLAMVPHAYATSLAYGWNVLNRHGADSPAGRWRVRNMIVWARPNPPVGALGDKVRPATSYITVACTSAKRWFDLDAVRDGNYQPRSDKIDMTKVDTRDLARKAIGLSSGNLPSDNNPAGAPPLDWWEDDDPTGHATLILPTQPYPGAHYATWPPALARRLVEMMCPLRVCLECGEPSRRITENDGGSLHDHNNDGLLGMNRPNPRKKEADRVTNNRTTGWTECDCVPVRDARVPANVNDQSGGGSDRHVRLGAGDRPPGDATAVGSLTKWRQGVVLDPFAGSGTTLAVAQGCGRDAIGIELYPHNADLIADRCGMFLEVDGGDDAAA